MLVWKILQQKALNVFRAFAVRKNFTQIECYKKCLSSTPHLQLFPAQLYCCTVPGGGENKGAGAV